MADKRPNFLVFMTDHQRGDMQPPFGIIKTPNLDRLHAAGVSFTNAYCPSPHCCPSRATFFSGLYPSEHGVWDNVNVSNAKSRGLCDGVRLFSEDMRDAGYKMLFAGKWHVSDKEGPDRRGFDMLCAHWERYKDEGYRPSMSDWDTYGLGWPISDPTAVRGEGEIVRPGFHKTVMYGERNEPHHDAVMVDAAIRGIEGMPDGESFLMYVGVGGPHSPYMVSKEFLAMYDLDEIALPESFTDTMGDKPAMYRRIRERYGQLTETEHRKALLHYYAYCTYEDFLFGRLLDALEAKGLLESTVVIYNSDHGDYAAAHGLWEKGLPGFREAYHVNSVVGYGGVKGGGRVVDEFVSLADYAPTFLEMAGIEAGRRFCGASLRPFLEGGRPEGWRTEMFTQTNGNENYGIQRAVFDRKYKYVYNAFDYDELYDLEADPHEVRNLIAHGAYERGGELDAVVLRMWERLYAFAYENKDGIANGYMVTAMAPYGPMVYLGGDGAPRK
ncbi:MAG: sulfatase-like hydrolase/transferase [Oscillospiraceae bacterium]|nr:sulfatase-like hydrolase/transferase [Oscillospiraceae bacterium]